MYNFIRLADRAIAMHGRSKGGNLPGPTEKSAPQRFAIADGDQVSKQAREAREMTGNQA